MNEEPSAVEGWAIGHAALVAYLDYVCRDEITKYLESGKISADIDADQVAAELKKTIIKRVADDVAEHTPEVFGDLGRRLREAVS